MPLMILNQTLYKRAHVDSHQAMWDKVWFQNLSILTSSKLMVQLPANWKSFNLLLYSRTQRCCTMVMTPG